LTKARLWCVGETIEARSGLRAFSGEVDTGSPLKMRQYKPRADCTLVKAALDGRRQMALLTLTTSKTKTAKVVGKTPAVKTTAE
jgi:hypothetical protein